ncbi:HNH endonuclease [Mycobacteroides salmoniphilum]|uniref:HNH endonuclease n=1 Tax=Mycobacteroides salmoniphilum TaxID=404941 RepID=UPI000993B776|nr:HNH endonuclease [Mycobacteroides salmoniphilum]
MSSVDRDVTEATNVLTCRDLTHSSEPQVAPVAKPVSAGEGARRVASVFAGAVLTVAAVAGLHGLYRAGGDVAAWGMWIVLLLAAMTALAGGVKLITWGAKPVIAAVSATGKERLSEPVQAVIAALGVIAGALGMWWTLRGGYSSWWQHISGETRWTLLLGAGQMLVAVVAGAALFTGGKYLTGLAKEVLTDAGMLGARDRATDTEGAGVHRHTAAKASGGDEKLWHPGLLAALIGGGAGLVLLTAGITPRLYVWITGPDVLPAMAAIAAALAWAIGSNLGWWKGLAGLYVWATDASQKAGAVAGVVAVLMFSASGLGLGWFTPATVPQAHAACPPDCGGPGGNDGPPGGGQMFQPPSQGGPQMPDYQGGVNQPPMDQNGSISIYNTQAPSISNNGVNGSNGQQGPQQGWDQPAHGTQPPDYQNATPYTQGPGKPNPDFNGGQTNPGTNTGSQGGQANQGAQSGNQGAQQPQQPPSQNSGQQPPQNQPPQNNTGQQPNQQPNQSDQQKIDDLTRQLQDQQQQGTQDRQRIDDLTKQLQQQGQQKQNGNQKLPKAPSKDKKKDDKKDEQQDRDQQSDTTDLASLLLGAGSTRRRKQDEQQPPQDQQQGPDTQALAQDGAQLGQSLPGDIANTVSDSANLGQSAGSAAQNFGSAAQAGASLASSAQSGAVNPMDAVALVQGVSGGISDTADAVGSGASIASTWINNAGQGAQLAADANPQLQPQAQQVQQLTQAGGQVADLTGKVAGGISQISGVVNTVSSLGASGMPDTSGATDALSGTATAVDGPTDIPTPPTPPSAPSSGAQALDSTTRAPQQPYRPAQPPSPTPSSPQAPKTASQTSTPKPLSPLEASAFPAPLQALNSTQAATPDPNAGSFTGAMGVLDQHRPPPEEYKPAWGEGVMQQFADGVNGRSDGVVGAFNGARNLVGLGGEGAPGVGQAWGDLAKSGGEALKEHLTTPPIVGIVDRLKHNIDEPVGQYVGETLFDGGTIAIGGPLGGEGAASRAVIGDVATTEVKALPKPPVEAEIPSPGGSTYKQRLDKTPINNGQWTGQRGESKWLSQNPLVNQFLHEAGVDGVEYGNARPDFGPVAKGQVEIPNMTTSRPKNFNAADGSLAQIWGVTPKDVAKWRSDNKYTWHEEPNLTTMQLVPSIVNGRLGHIGGVGELNAGKTLPPIGDGS